MSAGENEVSVAALKCPQCGAGLPGAGGHLVCQYCGSSLVVTGREVPRHAGEAEKPDVGGEAEVRRGMRLEPYLLPDPEGSGLDVLRMLVPVGWTKGGEVRWDLRSMRMPATITCRVANPSGLEVFEILPTMSFTVSSPMGGWMVAGQSFGAEIRQPTDAQTALRDLVIPRYRGDRAGLNIVRIVQAQELAEAVAAETAVPMGAHHCDGARARIAYQSEGQHLEEEIFGVVEVWQLPSAAMFGAMDVFWYVSHIVACRAAEGKLDDLAGLYEILIRSIKVNPQWMGVYEQVIGMLAQGQIHHVYQIAQLGSMYAQTGTGFGLQDQPSWFGRQQVWGGSGEEGGEWIGAVQSYRDPYQGLVMELPSQYSHAWASRNGEVIVTDDPDFDPNKDVDSGGEWARMQAR